MATGYVVMKSGAKLLFGVSAGLASLAVTALGAIPSVLDKPLYAKLYAQVVNSGALGALFVAIASLIIWGYGEDIESGKRPPGTKNTPGDYAALTVLILCLVIGSATVFKIVDLSGSLVKMIG